MGSFTHRQHRGFEIASRQRIKEEIANCHWIVPTQNKNAERITKYNVRNDSGKWHCDCPDHQKTSTYCKHIWAVNYYGIREEMRGHRKDKREYINDRLRSGPPSTKTYRREWAKYRKARINQKPRLLSLLTDLLDYIPAQPRKRGRHIDWRSAVVATVMKVYEGTSADIFMDDYRAVCDMGIADSDCCPNTILNHMGRPELEIILKELIGVSCLPLAQIENVLAIDSTGFGTPRFVTFYNHKYRGAHEKGFVTAHMACGVKTKIIAAVEISSDADPVMMPCLFEQARERIKFKELVADKAYSSSDIYELVAARDVRAYIEHKSNHNGSKAGNAFKESLRYYQYHNDDFYKHYHMRSNIESAFSMMKRNFGHFLWFRDEQAQKNEILCKVLCHNLACLIHSFEELDVDLSALKKPTYH